ncbi:MAG TPA: hypothetical protein VHV74_21940 [Pseudonocardiaceae bacterium]|jgi:hypothetical protein|nr:hypothetical protein [Pseudonocardiaceae bacterium]
MTALVRYTVANVLLSQRYLPPVLVFFALMAVFTAADGGPLGPDYAVSAAAVFICGTWLTIATVNAEDPTQRTITVVTAGGSGRVLTASAVVASGGIALLGVVGLLYPLTTGQHDIGPTVLILGLLAELTGAGMGVAVGLLCSRLVIHRIGWSVLVALTAILGFLLVPGLPPVHPVFVLLAGDRPLHEDMAPVAGFAALSVALAVGATLVTRFVALRRD